MGRTHGDAVKDASLVQVARWCELVQKFKSSKGSSTCSASWFKRAKALVQKVQEFKGQGVQKLKNAKKRMIIHSSFFILHFFLLPLHAVQGNGKLNRASHSFFYH
ncbi:MAG: hypothetical protein J6P01_05665 [Prevotella sp.]|nr:hypothetical protein [Prevotella sp.]